MISDFAKRLFNELQSQMPGLDKLIPAREFQAALQAVLARLNLVTREEFDAQTAVLQRTRAKLEVLEMQLAQLENRQSN